MKPSLRNMNKKIPGKTVFIFALYEDFLRCLRVSLRGFKDFLVWLKGALSPGEKS